MCVLGVDDSILRTYHNDGQNHYPDTPILGDRIVVNHRLRNRVVVDVDSVPNLSHRNVDVWKTSFRGSGITLGEATVAWRLK